MKLYEQFFRFTFFKQQPIYQQTIEVVILAYANLNLDEKIK